jgi:divalent metal cation (Fe/Co/Zn/Cd) transporter
MTVYESHEIATQVREKIRSEVDWVADVLVHVEPHMLGTLEAVPRGLSAK